MHWIVFLLMNIFDVIVHSSSEESDSDISNVRIIEGSEDRRRLSISRQTILASVQTPHA